jgi:hypothetical protein
VAQLASVQTGAPAWDDYHDDGPPADLAFWAGSDVSLGLRLVSSDQTRLVDTGLSATTTATVASVKRTGWDLFSVESSESLGSGRIDVALSDGSINGIRFDVVDGVDDIIWVRSVDENALVPPDQSAPDRPDRTVCFRAVARGRLVRGAEFSGALSGGTSSQAFARSPRNCFALSPIGETGQLTVIAGGYTKAFSVDLR